MGLRKPTGSHVSTCESQVNLLGVWVALFERTKTLYATLAQLAEHSICNRAVVGSTPIGGSVTQTTAHSSNGKTPHSGCGYRGSNPWWAIHLRSSIGRASVFGTECWGFESLRGYTNSPIV